MNYYYLKVILISTAGLASISLLTPQLRAQITHTYFSVYPQESLVPQDRLEATENLQFSEIMSGAFTSYLDLEYFNEVSFSLFIDSYNSPDKSNFSYVNALREALGVVLMNTKGKLITTSYFSRLDHQKPWDVDQNTRNLLMCLPACAPGQKSSVLPFRVLRSRRTRVSQTTLY
jgi:hypothetical protein